MGTRIRAISSTLPQYLVSLQRQSNVGMLRNNACGVIPGRAVRGDVGTIGDQSFGIGIPCSHGYDFRALTCVRIGIEFYPEITSRKLSRPNLHLEKVPPVTRFYMDAPEVYGVPSSGLSSAATQPLPPRQRCRSQRAGDNRRPPEDNVLRCNSE